MARDITIRYVGDSSSAERAAAKVRAANEKMSSGFANVAQSASTNFRSVGRSLTSAGRSITMFATLPIAGGFGLAIKAASDLNEQASKMETVFGDQSTAIRRFADTSAEALGLSRKATYEATGTFGNMFSQLGIAPQITAKWSTSLTQAAADLGSFHNADISQVIEAQTAAFRGEYDALQRFIPTISAATVQQRAMADTGKTNAQQLTEGEKAAATYAIMMEGLGAAQGDFARTAEGAANTQRTLQARFQDLAASIGEKLLPFALRFGGILADLLDRFNNLSPAVQKGVLVAAALFAAMGPLVGAVGALATAIGLLIGTAGLIVLALAAVVVGVVYAYTHFEGFREIVDNAIASVIQRFQELRAWAIEIWPQIQETVTHVVNVVQAAWRLFGDDILNYAIAIWDSIMKTIDGALKFIQGLIQFVLAVINGDWGKAWEGIKMMFEGIWLGIQAILQRALAAVQLVLGAAYAAIQAAASVAWQWVSDRIFGAWETIKSTVSGAAAWVRDTLAGVWDSIYAKFFAVWSAISGALGAIWAGIRNAVVGGINNVIGVLNSFIGKVNGILSHLPGGFSIGTIDPLASGGVSPGGYVGGARPTGFAAGGSMAPFITDGIRAIVGEGKPGFPEYVIPTDPKYRSRAQSLAADLLPKLMASGGRIPMLASGGIPNPLGGVVDFFRKGAATVAMAIPNKIAETLINAQPWEMARAFGNKIRQALYDFVKGEDDKLPDMPPIGGGGAVGFGVERWRSVALQALAYAGQSVAWINDLLRQMQHESGGNQFAINRTDINARLGHPSQGLMQTIPSTFTAYARELAGRGIYDPFANIVAAIRYTVSRYGDLGAWARRGFAGYKNGTDYVPHDGLAYLHKGEAVTSAGRNRGTIVNIDLRGSVGLDEDAIARLVVSGLKTAGDKGMPISVNGRRL